MRFLFVDRIIQSAPGEWIKGVKHITQDDSCLTQDKQGRPCFISSLIGETLGQLAAWNVMARNQFTLRPVAGVVASARLCRPAYVGETLLLESYIDAVDDTAVQYHSIARVNDEPVFIIEGALGPLLPMEHFISPQDAQHQYEEIYRPGDWEALKASYVNISHIDDVNANLSVCKNMSFDRIVAFEASNYMLAEKKVSRAAPYLPDHFPKKPVLPMTVLLECIQQLTEQFLIVSALEHYQITELRRIKMNEFVLPGDVLLCMMKVKNQTDNELVLSCRSEVEGKRVCVVEVVLNAKGK